MVMAGPPLTQIDLRSSLDLVDVIKDTWQALHSKLKQTFLQKLLVERKHVSDFGQFLKEIDFRSPISFVVSTGLYPHLS